MELTKQTYFLAEAAKILRCSTDDLLRRGAEGSLRIYAPKPKCVVILNVGSADLDPEKLIVRRRIQATHAKNVKYLLLDHAACKRLLNGAPPLSGVFDAGGTFDENGNWRAVLPDHCIDRSQQTSSAPRGDRKFALYTPDVQLGVEGALVCPESI